jgi:hypothetical protein
MKYTHIFGVELVRRFDSDIENFDEAFDQWVESFKDSLSLRRALLGRESTRSLLKGLIWSETFEPD